MNTALVKTVPPGDFAEISALKKGWETKFQSFVSENRPIKFDMYPFPGIPPEIREHLNQQGYKDLILENDRWQHFLVPNPNRPQAAQRQNQLTPLPPDRPRRTAP